MTRETKIGLLVGLAFIIVIGILLSDHLTTRGELPAAQLTQVGDNVRAGNAIPLSSNAPLAPVTVSNNVAPSGVVKTHDEINSASPVEIVQIGPSNKSGLIAVGPAPTVDSAVITRTPSAQSDHLLIAEAAATTTPEVAPATAPVDPLANDPLMKPATSGQTPSEQAEPAAAKNLKPIKAEKGDTLSRFASKYLGANTTANRQAIIDANPTTLKIDPAKIIIGHTYMIPTKPIEANATVAKAVEPPSIPETVPYDNSSKPEAKSESKPVARNTEKSADKADKSSKSASTYTVKSNDTLWKIAGGDPAVVKELEALNKDVLKGKGLLHPGVVLKLPAKTAVAAR